MKIQPFYHWFYWVSLNNCRVFLGYFYLINDTSIRFQFIFASCLYGALRDWSTSTVPPIKLLQILSLLYPVIRQTLLSSSFLAIACLFTFCKTSNDRFSVNRLTSRNRIQFPAILIVPIILHHIGLIVCRFIPAVASIAIWYRSIMADEASPLVAMVTHSRVSFSPFFKRIFTISDTTR